MVRDRAGRTACHRLLERPQAPLCLGSQTAPSHPTSSRYRSNAESRIDLADAPLSQTTKSMRETLSADVIDLVSGGHCSCYTPPPRCEPPPPPYCEPPACGGWGNVFN